MQRQVAADWVLKLFNLAPKDVGIDHIYFLMVGSQQSQLNKEREHPLSDLIKEKVVWVKGTENTMVLRTKLKKPMKTLALWLASDGDDTKSAFKVKIKNLKLNPGPVSEKPAEAEKAENSPAKE